MAPFFIGGGFLISWIKSGRELNKNVVEMAVGMGLAQAYMRGDFIPIDERYLTCAAESVKKEFENESKLLKEWDEDIKRLENEIQTKEQKQQSVQNVIFAADARGKKAIASIEAYKEQSSSLTTTLQSKNLTVKYDHVKAEIDAEEKSKLEQDIKIALEMAVKAEKDRLEAERVAAKYKAELEEIQREKEKFESDKRKLECIKKSLEKKREEELRSRFSAILKNLVIDDHVFEWLSRQMDSTVVIQTEAALHEYNSGSFVMHSRGKIQNTDYFHNSFGPNDAYRIYYCRKSKTYIAAIGSKKEQNQNIQWLQKHPYSNSELSSAKMITQ
jgi:tRNA(Phe) wybutosine-synthesizing methylase Tyw3